MVPLIIDIIMPSLRSTRMLSWPMWTLPFAPLRATSTRSPSHEALRSYSRLRRSTSAWALARAASRPRVCLRSTLIWVMRVFLNM